MMPYLLGKKKRKKTNKKKEYTTIYLCIYIYTRTKRIYFPLNVSYTTTTTIYDDQIGDRLPIYICIYKIFLSDHQKNIPTNTQHSSSKTTKFYKIPYSGYSNTRDKGYSSCIKIILYNPRTIVG